MKTEKIEDIKDLNQHFKPEIDRLMKHLKSLKVSKKDAIFYSVYQECVHAIDMGIIPYMHEAKAIDGVLVVNAGSQEWHKAGVDYEYTLGAMHECFDGLGGVDIYDEYEGMICIDEDYSKKEIRKVILQEHKNLIDALMRLMK